MIFAKVSELTKESKMIHNKFAEKNENETFL